MALSQPVEVNDSNGDVQGSGAVFLSTVKQPLFYTFCALSGLVLVFDVICLVFFILFRKRKLVRIQCYLYACVSM